MRAIDRIHKYIQDEKAAGNLSAGDRLPSYHKFMSIGKGSYATILSAMKKLETEGILEIRNGAGSFVAGGKTLRVCILYNPQELPEMVLAELFSKHLKNTGLNLELSFYPLILLWNPEAYRSFINEQQAAIIIGTPPAVLPTANLSEFDEYDKEYRDLAQGDLFRLPFSTFSSQFAMNRSLVEKAHFDPDRMDSSLEWWSEFVEACRRYDLHPASMQWNDGETLAFQLTYGLLLALFDFGAQPQTSQNIEFASDAGRRFLQIIHDHHFYSTGNRSGSFFINEACMNFYTGSWITAQNRNPNRPDICVDSLYPIPIMGGGKPVKLLNQSYLSAYFGKDATVEARKRVWALMTLMTGYGFQLDYCNASGTISMRDDIKKNDYSWNRDGTWDVFFPAEGDATVHMKELFSINTTAALTILLEDYLFHGADAETTLYRMDQKNNDSNVLFDLKTGVSKELHEHHIRFAGAG